MLAKKRSLATLSCLLGTDSSKAFRALKYIERVEVAGSDFKCLFRKATSVSVFGAKKAAFSANLNFRPLEISVWYAESMCA